MKPTTFVIVLAQGSQKRMDWVKQHKQLLGLVAHQAALARNTTILSRTVAMVARHLAPDGDLGFVENVELVTWPAVWFATSARLPLVGAEPGARVDISLSPGYAHLTHPGNSSIAGLRTHMLARRNQPADRFVVLLGDVLYSWRCLDTLFDGKRPVTFATSYDIAPDRGELWGVSWDASQTDEMMAALERGYAASSKVEGEYQPGQLRHWLWAYDKRVAGVSSEMPWHYKTPSSDYTMDVDTPDHLVRLASASLYAFEDDRERGIL